MINFKWNGCNLSKILEMLLVSCWIGSLEIWFLGGVL